MGVRRGVGRWDGLEFEDVTSPRFARHSGDGFGPA